MAKKKVFASYDNDKHYKNLLVAWDANNEFTFSFYDASVDMSVDSDNAATIKRVISACINSAMQFLCIVGKKTHMSKWVAWEIDKAVELKKKIVAVKTSKGNTTPTGLYGVGEKWALSLTFASIKKALGDA